MKLMFKNVFSKVAMTSVMVFALLVGAQSAFAAAPTASSATIVSSTSSTVTITITGTNYVTFVASGTTTAGAADLTKISYNSVSPTSATSNGSTTITAVFPIAVGTGKSGGALTIAADAVQDGSSLHNTPLSVANGSITDTATPQVLSVSPAASTTNVNRGSNVVITFSEAMTTGSLAFSTSPSGTYVPTWSAGNSVVTLAHTADWAASTSHTATIATGTTDSASVALAAPYVWSFTTRNGTSNSTVITTTDNNGTTTTTSSNGTVTTTPNNTPITTTDPVMDYSGCASASGFSTTTGKSCAGMPTPTVVVIAGCEGRNTGFSTVNGASCTGNTVTSTGTVIAGCTGTAGFSTVNGMSCAGNTAVTTSPTPSTNASMMITATTGITKASGMAAIKSLQAALNHILGTTLTVDGKWGAQTSAAVIKFQAWAKISADGKVGPMTIAKLNASMQ